MIHDAYFEVLQSLSPSSWIIREPLVIEKPNEFHDIHEMYLPLLHGLDLEDVRGGSVQVTGPAGSGRSAVLKHVAQCMGQQSSVVVLENFPASAAAKLSGLYPVYLSLIHQIISQRPSLFLPVRNLIAEISNQQSWTEDMLRVILSLIFLHSEHIEFLVVVYDLETWSSEVQDCWFKFHTLFPECSRTRCILAVSCLELHDNFTNGKSHHLDLSDYHKRHKTTVIREKMHLLLKHDSRAKSLFERNDDRVKDAVISAAQSFAGPFLLVRELLSHMFSTTILSAPKVMQDNISVCPVTSERFHLQLLQILASKPPMVFDWATRALSWVLLAIRPIHLDELAAALAINASRSDILDIHSNIPLDLLGDIKQHLSGLIFLDAQRIRIFSSTARKTILEYYQGQSANQRLRTHYDLTLQCLQYLTLLFSDENPETWKKCLCKMSYKYNTRKPRDVTMGLLDYACQYWPLHFLNVEHPDAHLKGEVVRFLQRPEISNKWFRLYLLNIGVQPGHFAEGPSDAIGMLDPQVECLTLHAGTNKQPTGWGQAFAVEGVSSAAVMAGYVGLASILPDLLEDESLENGMKVIHVKHGHSERDVAIFNSAARLYVECKIPRADEGGVNDLLQEMRDGIPECYPLHTASLSGSVKLVQMLFAALADPMLKDVRGRTPLHMSSIGGNVEVTRFLLERGSGVDLVESTGRLDLLDAKDEKSQTPLILALRMGQVEAARYLIRSRANLRLTDWAGKTALHYAVLNCSPVVRDIVTQDPGTVLLRDEDQRTPLHLAAHVYSGTVASIIDVLNTMGASSYLEEAVDAIDASNRTPMHYAAEYGHLEAAVGLLKAGASLDTEDSWLFTAAELASQNGHLSVLKALTREREEDRTRLLLAASRSGQILIVQYLLNEEVSPEGNGEFSRGIPLLLAASEGHNHVVAMLLRYGADVNSQDLRRMSALHHAVTKRHYEVAKTLLSHELGPDKAFNIDSPDLSRYTPLHYAAESGHVKLARLLIEHGAYVDSRSQGSRTPLHLGANNAEIVQLLLEEGAELDSRDIMEQTPLHIAVCERDLRPARVLIRWGADINAIDDDDRTPLHIAIAQNNLPMTRLLTPNTADDHNAERGYLELAVREDALEVLKYLAERTQNAMKAADGRQRTLLSLAAETSKCSVKTMEFLLHSGSVIGNRGRWGRSPLHEAVADRKLPKVKLLIEHKAEINLEDTDGETPLHVAASERFDDAVAALLAAGASPDKVDNKQRTPLFNAAYGGYPSIVEKLLEKEAKIDLCDHRKWHPLHAAADNIEVIELLLRKKADVDFNCQTSDMETPLHLAVSWDCPAVIQFLLDKGADPKLKTDAGFNCLDIAAQASSTESLGIIIGADQISKPASIWSPTDLTAAYWKAVEGEKIGNVKFLVKNHPHLRDELSEEGLNGLQACLSSKKSSLDEDELIELSSLANQFLDIGVDPFHRQNHEQMSAFELGFGLHTSSPGDAIRDFLDDCLDKIPSGQIMSTLSLRELRIALNLDRVATLRRLGTKVEDHRDETDQDGWDIHHVLCQAQANPKFGLASLNQLVSEPRVETRAPCSLISPMAWQQDSPSCIISSDGLEVSFEGRLFKHFEVEVM